MKGKQVYVEGRIQTRQWDDKDGNKRHTTEVKADRLTLLGGGRNGDTDLGASRAAEALPDPPMEPITDDDIPFAWLLPLMLPALAAVSGLA